MSVVSGLDVFLDPGGDLGGLPRGAKIGLLAHPASVDGQLVHALDRIVEDGRLEVVRLFAPEHGLRGEAQDMEAVREGEDATTGIRVVSLYGDDATSLRPTPCDLEGLDAVVCDLQDVGSRYYTFVYTISYVMEAARDAGIPVVVLDRPNPIGANDVEGPVLIPDCSSFVGRYALPVRHGMTVGELTALFRDAFGVGGRARVVPMAGYRRAMHHEETGLPWVLPSPNMPTPETARVYPGGCLVEGTNLSEGRGTTRPFECVGAPWIDGHRLAVALRSVASRDRLAGALFRAVRFRPTFHKHGGRSCGGVQIHIGDRRTFRPFATYLALLREALRLDPKSFAWRREAYEFESDRLAIDLLLGRPDLRPLLEGGATVPEMEALWERDLAAFVDLRRRFLIYPD